MGRRLPYCTQTLGQLLYSALALVSSGVCAVQHTPCGRLRRFGNALLLAQVLLGFFVRQLTGFFCVRLKEWHGNLSPSVSLWLKHLHAVRISYLLWWRHISCPSCMSWSSFGTPKKAGFRLMNSGRPLPGFGKTDNSEPDESNFLSISIKGSCLMFISAVRFTEKPSKMPVIFALMRALIATGGYCSEESFYE